MAGIGSLVVIGLLLTWAAAVWICEAQAEAKGRIQVLWVIAGVVFGVVAAAAILALPPKLVDPKRCQACLSLVPGAARRCRYCCADLE